MRLLSSKGKILEKPLLAKQAVKTKMKEKPIKKLTPAPVFRKPAVSVEQRRGYVEVAAYFMAERHGFAVGREQDFWIAAEAAIDRMIAEGLLQALFTRRAPKAIP